MNRRVPSITPRQLGQNSSTAISTSCASDSGTSAPCASGATTAVVAAGISTPIFIAGIRYCQRIRSPMLYVAVTRIGYISRAGSAIDNQLNRFDSSTERTLSDRTMQ